MSYVDFKIDYDVPFGRMSTLYEKLGIFKILEDRKVELGFEDPENWLLDPSIVACNEATREKLLKQWEYNWKNYNYDHRTGMPKVKTLKKYKNPHSLSLDDRHVIAWNFYLGDGPASNDDIPDDILRVNMDWDISSAKRREEC